VQDEAEVTATYTETRADHTDPLNSLQKRPACDARPRLIGPAVVDRVRQVAFLRDAPRARNLAPQGPALLAVREHHVRAALARQAQRWERHS